MRCRGAACRFRCSGRDSQRLPIKTHKPIASVAALSERLAGLQISGRSVDRTGSQICHCEEARRPTWQSCGVMSDHRKAIGEIAAASPRFPRRFAPRNDTSGWCGGAPVPLRCLITPYQAVTDRRYIFLSRGSLAQRAPLQTQLVHTILTAACTSWQHCAGSGMPLPYNGGCIL